MPQISLPREIAGTLKGYFAAQFKIAAILAVLYTIGYGLAGVPLWYLLGPLSGALNLIPVVGSVLALILAGILALWGNDPMRNYLGIVATFVLVQGLEGFYLTPKLMGGRVGLSGLTVFLAILVGGMLFGPIGMLVAVPLLAVLAIIWRRSRKRV